MSAFLPTRWAGAAFFVALAAAALDALLAVSTRLRAPSALAAALGIGAAVSALVWLRARLRREADEEARDAELESRDRAAGSGWLSGDAATAGEPFSAARSLARVEAGVRWLAAPLAALAQAAAAYGAWRLLRAPALAPPSGELQVSAALAGQAFGLFLLGRTLLGLARSPEGRLLRGPGLWLTLGAFGSLLASLSALAAGSGWPPADGLAAGVCGGALALLAGESAGRALGEWYRPRSAAAAEPCAAYESRWARILCEPASWTRGAAATLDYQFGLQVSGAWFARFVRAALLPLAVFQLLILWGLSSLVFLGPEEEGIRERFGRPLPEAEGGRLGSGFHWIRPWPFETVRRLPVHRVLTTHIGYEAAPGEEPDLLLWTRAHFASEDPFLVSAREPPLAGAAPAAPSRAEEDAPFHVLNFNVPIAYGIRDPYAFAYGHADVEGELRALAARCLTREAAGRDAYDLMGPGRAAAAAALRDRLQAAADRRGLGVDIRFVGLQGVHPPVALADAYEAVIGALENRQTVTLQAQAYAAGVRAAAEAEARAATLAAEAYRARRALTAAAEAEQFQARRAGHDRAPAVFKSRRQLDAVRAALREARLYVVAAESGHEVLQFNLEERLPASLFDWSPKSESPSP